MRESLAIGIGCTRGTPCAVLAAGIDAVLARHALTREAIRVIASIDAKRDEPGLVALARANGWALRFFAAHALAEVATAQPSDIVRDAVGTPGVAEPAAVLVAAGGPLRVPKTVFAADGHTMTVAVAALREPSHG